MGGGTPPYRRPKNAESAAAAAAALLRRGLPGKRSAVAVHIRRAEGIAAAIFERFAVIPAQWQAKNLRWYLAEFCSDLTPATRYDHWRTVRNLAIILQKFSDWETHISGSWCRPDGVWERGSSSGATPHRGGRPRKI